MQHKSIDSEDYLSHLPPELLNLILLHLGDPRPLQLNRKLRNSLNSNAVAPFWKLYLRQMFPTFILPPEPADYQQLCRELARKEKAMCLKFSCVNPNLYNLIFSGSLKQVKALVDQERKACSSLSVLFNTADHRSITAVRLAALYGRSDILAYIFENFVETYFTKPGATDPLENSRLYWAACCGIVAEFVNFSLPNDDDMDILVAAVLHGHNDIVDLLLKAKVNPNRQHPSALTAAAESGNLYALKALLKSGAHWKELSNEYFNPLWIAAKKGFTDIVKELLASGAQPIVDRDGNTIIYLAAQHGHADVVRLFVNSDIKVDQVAPKSQTPLYIAATHGHADVVDVLLEAGASINFAPNGETALCAASRKGHVDVVNLLIAKGASLDNAFHLAAAHNNLRVMNSLIAAKADVNGNNQTGQALREQVKTIIAANISTTPPARSWVNCFFATPEVNLVKLLNQINLPIDQHDAIQILKNFCTTYRSLLGENKYNLIVNYILTENSDGITHHNESTIKTISFV